MKPRIVLKEPTPQSVVFAAAPDDPGWCDVCSELVPQGTLVCYDEYGQFVHDNCVQPAAVDKHVVVGVEEPPARQSKLDADSTYFPLGWVENFTLDDLTRYQKRAHCSVKECRNAVNAPGWDCSRPLQGHTPPADMCVGHGQMWAIAQALIDGYLAEDTGIRFALEYASQAFRFDAAILVRCQPNHYLYRLWDKFGALLYVGETDDITRRLREHSKTKHWWHEVRGHTHEPHPTEAAARIAEDAAIKIENPKYNIAGKPKESRQRTLTNAGSARET